MGFHRFAIPTYTGGLPGGYNYINNATSGVPAAAAGPRSDGGPNDGTYFLGFGENAIGENVNRGLKALAENTDILDDLLRRDIAIPKQNTIATAATPITSVVVSGPGVFLGIPGHPNTVAGLADLFSVVDENDNDIIDPTTGVKCRVTAISGGTVGSNFSTTHITCTVNPAIPTGKQYKIWHGFRGNLATFTADQFSCLSVRTAQEADHEFLDLRQQISRISSTNVQALIASIIETPNGVRLPRAENMYFDVDPDDGIGSNSGWSFTFRRTRDVTPLQIAQLIDWKVAPQGMKKTFTIGAAAASEVTGVGSDGLLSLFDSNTFFTGDANGLPIHLPFTESTNGGSYTRVGEKPRAISILRSLNARAYVTGGNGTTTFGDFNGATSIMNALTHFGSTGTIVIHLKPGTYTLDATVVIPAGLEVIIEGDGDGTQIVTGNAGPVLTGGTLTLKDLRLEGVGAMGVTTVTGAGYIRWKNCTVTNHMFAMTNPNPLALNVLRYSNWYNKPTLLVEDCTIDNSAHVDATGTTPLLHLLVGDNLEHQGFIFRRCQIRMHNHNTPVKIEAVDSSILETRVRRLVFDDCKIMLGGASASSGYLLTNAGLIWINPKNSVRKLGVDDVRWLNCDVWANHLETGTCSTLLHLAPVPIDYDSTTSNGISHLGRFHIEGGEWNIPEVDTAICAFTMIVRTPIIRDLNIRQSNKLTGAPPKDAYWYVNNSGSVTHSVWGAITFHFKNESSFPFELSRSADIDGIRIRNVLQAQCSVTSGVSDFYFKNTGNSIIRIENIRIYAPANGTAAGGFKPVYRVQIDVGTPGTIIENVVWDGTGANNDGTTWVVTGGYFANFYGGGGGFAGPVTFSKCGVRGVGGSSGSGILASTTGFTVYGDCFATNTTGGLTAYTFQGGGVCNIVGGSYNNNGASGIYLLADAFFTPRFNLVGVTANYNGGHGLNVLIPGASWMPHPSNATLAFGTVVNTSGCTFVGNNGTSPIQAKFEFIGLAGDGGASGSKWMSGSFIGNVLRSEFPAGIEAGEVQFLGQSSLAVLVNMRGLIRADGTIADGGFMAHNFGVLRTS